MMLGKNLNLIMDTGFVQMVVRLMYSQIRWLWRLFGSKRLICNNRSARDDRPVGDVDPRDPHIDKACLVYTGSREKTKYV